MTDLDPGAAAFLGFLILQRLSELVLARLNTTRLLARGATEHGESHYPLIVALHAAWIAALVIFGLGNPVSPAWLAAFVVLQALRIWILASLRDRWTTRIIVLDEPLVARGPFRFVRHPNYMVVAAEIVVASMVLGLPWVAAIFTLLNAAVLAIRIRAEDAALSGHR
jgi:methyltransferase